MVMIPNETDKVKLHALLGSELSRKNPNLAGKSINSNAYRLSFLEGLPIESKMFEIYKERLQQKGAIQGVRGLSEFSRLVIACNSENVTPEQFD